MAKMSIIIAPSPVQPESVDRSRDKKARAEKVQFPPKTQRCNYKLTCSILLLVARYWHTVGPICVCCFSLVSAGCRFEYILKQVNYNCTFASLVGILKQVNYNCTSASLVKTALSPLGLFYHVICRRILVAWEKVQL